MRRIIPIILIIAGSMLWPKEYRFADGMAVTINNIAYGRMRVIGTHIWLDSGKTMTEGWITIPPSCPIPGWRLPTKEEMEALVRIAKASGDSERYLQEVFHLNADERFLMTSTKVHPDVIDGSKAEAWDFYGYDHKSDVMKEIQTFGVIAQWSGYKKTDMSAHYIMDIPSIDYDEAEEMSVRFKCVVPNVVKYAWSFGDGQFSDEKSPVHIYRSAGNYKVFLTIAGIDGVKETASLKINLLEQFGNNKNVRLDSSAIEKMETSISITYPLLNFFGNSHLTAAPVTALDNGGYAVMYTLENGISQIAVYSKNGTLERTLNITEKGVAAGIASHGEKIAFLFKIGKNRLDFRILGEDDKTMVIMDNGEQETDPRGFSNNGKGIVFMENGKMQFGTEAMFDPITLGRGNLLYTSGMWIASFTYANNFAASGTNFGKYQLNIKNSHYGELVVGFKGEKNSKPVLFSAWGVSHSIDLRTIYDGEYVAHISIGDVYPADFKFVVFTPDGNMISSTELFSKHAFPDALMGEDKDGKKLYGVAGGPGGVSAELGELLTVSRGEFFFTYRIKPGKYGNDHLGKDGYLSTKIDELGVIRLDKDGHILFRKKLLPGNNVEFLKSARFGRNFLIVWKETDKPVYRMMTINNDGKILDNPITLPYGIYFNASDPFVVLKNGEVVWTAAGPGKSEKGGKMVIFRIKLEG